MWSNFRRLVRQSTRVGLGLHSPGRTGARRTSISHLHVALSLFCGAGSGEYRGMNRPLVFLTAVLGFTGVALGALGAHALKRAAENWPDAVERLAWWELGARYHLIHALAVGLVAVLAMSRGTRRHTIAAAFFTAGVVLFSGSLYAMALTGTRGLGIVTPFGGLAFLAGWISVGVLSLSKSH